MPEGITLKRIIDMDETQQLSASDYVLVDSQTGGNRKYALGEELTQLKEDFNDLENITTDSNLYDEPVSLNIQAGYYYDDGTYHAEAGRQSAVVSPVAEGEKYKITCSMGSGIIYGVLFLNGSSVTSKILRGTGTATDYTDYEFTVPSQCDSMIVQNAYTDRSSLALKKEVSETVFKAYTKTESSNIFGASAKYGVRWKIDDPDDLGERCFGAVGVTASIGIGSTNGASDFDAIYPWSEIKRCNINKNANGAEIVTFEGETGFALDGTNGDVFVRIPKFYYERYIEDGYEYRVVSNSGANVHPAFIEDGKELDEIFISAFEGYVDTNNKLRSIGSVIPSSNILPQSFLDAAQANGNNYSLYDNRCVDAIWTLIAVEFGCRNTNQIFGYGLADFIQPDNDYEKNRVILAATGTNTIRTNKWTSAQKEFIPVGSNLTVCDTTQQNVITQAKILSCVDGSDYTEWTFDGDAIDVTTNSFIGSAAFDTNWCENEPSGNLTYHTGRGNWIANSNTRNPMRYRWIENLFGNLWHFLPDITFSGLQMYVCKNMKDYVMHKKVAPYYPENNLYTVQTSNGSKSDVTGANYWITTFDSGEFTKGVDFGRTFSQSLTSEKAFGAYYYLYPSDVIITNGGGFDHLYRCNMLTQRAWSSLDSQWYLYGARLMYKHLA